MADQPKKLQNLPAIHGWNFQLKLIMIVFTKALTSKLYGNFFVQAEDKENFFRFDDVSFTYGKKTILFQAKHVNNEMKTIDVSEIKATPCLYLKKLTDFALAKYYNSFLKMKLIRKNAEDIEHFILFTNYKLNENALELFTEQKYTCEFLNIPVDHQCVERVLSNDSAERTEEQKTPICYKINQSLRRDELPNVFHHTYMFFLIEEFFEQKIFQKKMEKEMILELFGKWILFKFKGGETIEETEFDLKKWVQVEERKPIEEKELVKALIQMLKNVEKVKTDNEAFIDEFCNKFIFATCQANEDEMTIILENEFAKISELPSCKLIDSKYLTIFSEWLKGSRTQTNMLTEEDGPKIVNFLKISAKNFSTNMKYQNEWKLNEVTFNESDEAIQLISSYIENNLDKNFLIVHTERYVLTLAKIYQCLKSEILFIKFDSNEVSVEQSEQLAHVKYYKNCVFVYSPNVRNPSVDEVLRYAGNNNPKIIFLIHSNIGYVPDLQDLSVFSDLQVEAQKKILKRVVNLDGKKVLFESLASIDVFQSCDSKTLSDIISTSEYCIKKNVVTVNSQDIKRVLKEKSHCKIESSLTIISDDPGMGKSRHLQTIFSQNKTSYPSRWIEIISLTKHNATLRDLEVTDDLFTYFMRTLLNYTNSFTRELIAHQIRNENFDVLFDAFDEISEKSREIIVRLIQILQGRKIFIWITTRAHVESVLHEKFPDCKIFSLQPFTEQNQRDYISIKCNGNEMLQKRCIEAMTKCKNISFSVPMHLAMTTEYFLTTSDDLNEVLSETNLYKYFIEYKYKYFIREKLGQSLQHENMIRKYDEEMKRFNGIHQSLALKYLCRSYVDMQEISFENWEINGIGIAFVENEMIDFRHKTFAEYFAATYYARMMLSTNVDENFIDYLLKVLLMNSDYMTLLKFLDELLEVDHFSESLIRILNKKFKDFGNMTLLKNLRHKNIIKLIYEAEPPKILRPTLTTILKYCVRDMVFMEKVFTNNWIDNFSNDYIIITLGELLTIVDSSAPLQFFLEKLKNQKDSTDFKKILTRNLRHDPVDHTGTHVHEYPTILFYQRHFSTFFLNYLKEQFEDEITELETFLLIKHDNKFFFEHYFYPFASAGLIWMKENMRESFLEELYKSNYPSLKRCIDDESFFIFYYNLGYSIQNIAFIEVAFNRQFKAAIDLILSKLRPEDFTHENAKIVLDSCLNIGDAELLEKLLILFSQKFRESYNDFRGLLKFNLQNLSFDDINSDDTVVRRNLKDELRRIASHGKLSGGKYLVSPTDRPSDFQLNLNSKVYFPFHHKF